MQLTTYKANVNGNSYANINKLTCLYMQYKGLRLPVDCLSHFDVYNRRSRQRINNNNILYIIRPPQNSEIVPAVTVAITITESYEVDVVASAGCTIINFITITDWFLKCHTSSACYQRQHR